MHFVHHAGFLDDYGRDIEEVNGESPLAIEISMIAQFSRDIVRIV